MESVAAAADFDTQFFQEMFLKEKELANKIPDKIAKLMVEAEERMEKIIQKNREVSQEEFDNLSRDLNNLTVADVYRYALNGYRNSDDMFNCGIERTKLLLGPKLFTDSYTVYQMRGGALSKVDYIQVNIFQKFYEYLTTYEVFDKERIYRFFIRLLGLADGFAVISNILIFNFTSVLRTTSASSSPQTSPEEPKSKSAEPEQFKNQNILQVSQVFQPQSSTPSSTSVSLKSVLFFRFSYPDQARQLPNSSPFSIQLEYDLVKMSNHPFDMLFYTFFKMNNYFKDGIKITPDSIIREQNKNIKNKKNIEREEESLFTRTFKGFQYIGGRTKITSKKRHRKIKYKKSRSKTKITNSRRYSSRSMSKSRRS
jgi:hypothetical protein